MHHNLVLYINLKRQDVGFFLSAQLQTGCVIAAPHSGAGKTLITLGILRALKRAGQAVLSAKVGPDYIDPAFHTLAGGTACINLDSWAMGPAFVQSLAASLDGLFIVEGVMGLFDGAIDGTGSTADIAAMLDLPVILIVDARAQSSSAAALLHGFKTFRHDVTVAGVIFNRVGSPRHSALLNQAAAQVGIPVLGCLPRDEQLAMPSRHLGLVQASEQADIEELIERAADCVAKHIDLAMLTSICDPLAQSHHETKPLPPLGQRIAIAQDDAFSFAYQHLLDGWRDAGAEILPFSPLANEAPDPSVDAVFLPGGYPELHAGTLSENTTFIDGLRARAKHALIYGECGGFMVMGDQLIDANGTAHSMAGLLPVTTSFEKRTRHLGYRKLTHDSPLPWPKQLRGHEFHYSTLTASQDGAALFQATNALDETEASMGMHQGRIMGSYAHVIAAEWSDRT